MRTTILIGTLALSLCVNAVLLLGAGAAEEAPLRATNGRDDATIYGGGMPSWLAEARVSLPEPSEDVRDLRTLVESMSPYEVAMLYLATQDRMRELAQAGIFPVDPFLDPRGWEVVDHNR